MRGLGCQVKHIARVVDQRLICDCALGLISSASNENADSVVDQIVFVVRAIASDLAGAIGFQKPLDTCGKGAVFFQISQRAGPVITEAVVDIIVVDSAGSAKALALHSIAFAVEGNKSRVSCFVVCFVVELVHLFIPSSYASIIRVSVHKRKGKVNLNGNYFRWR